MGLRGKANRLRRAELDGGSSALPGGVRLNFKLPRSERAVLRELVVRAGERDVLIAPVMLEDEARTKGSVRDIRGWITEAMLGVAEGSPAFGLLSKLRDTCNDCLRTIDARTAQGDEWEVIREELIRWRVLFAGTLASFGSGYGLEEANELADRISKELRWGFPDPPRRILYVPPPDDLPFDPPA